MAHSRLLFRLMVAITCMESTSACSASERLSEMHATAISEAATVTARGVDGLRQDIAWVQSLPAGTKLGTSVGFTTRDDAASVLKAHLDALSHSMGPSARSLALSPRSPDFDYISYGDVGGQTYVAPAGTDAQGYKYETTYAFTSCTQSSMTVAKVEPSGTLTDFSTGRYIGSLFFFPESAPQYVSVRATQGILTARLVSVRAETKHSCQAGEPNNWPYKTTNGFAVI